MLAELSKRKKSDEKLISDLKEHEKTMRGNIQEMHEKLQLQLNHASELFVAAKEMKERIMHISDSIKELQQDCQFEQFEFVCSKHVKEMVASQFKLGELLERRAVTGPIMVNKTFVDKKDITEVEPQFDSEIGIKASDDKEDCDINACALISYNRIILVDRSNNCLKVVDTENRNIAEKYKLKSKPYGLAIITKDRFAVSLPDEQKIQFLTLTQCDKITESNAIKVKGMYKNIACQENKIMMLYSDHVVILNMDGEVVKTIANLNMVSVIAIDSKSIYMSSFFESSVFKFDFEGKLIATYKDKDRSDVRGLCVTRDGTVLVCNWEDDGSIHMISRECKKIKEILKHNDHVRYPWCVSFCDETNKHFLCNNEPRLDPKLKNVINILQFK